MKTRRHEFKQWIFNLQISPEKVIEAIELFDEKLDLVISESQWKPYPEYLPDNQGDYIVQFPNGDMDLDHWNGRKWDMVGVYAIAFSELPKPYQVKDIKS